jgi:hypothetical protein
VGADARGDPRRALRGGQSWFQLAQRSGLDAAALQVAIPGSSDGGPLASAYAKLRAEDPARGVALDDAEVVGLVNLRFLSDFTRSQPSRVLEVVSGTGSWVSAYRSLVSR